MSDTISSNAGANIGVPESFDHYNDKKSEPEWRETYAAYRANCPVAHIDTYGGFYLISSYDAVRTAASSTLYESGDGVFIPPTGLPRIPALEFDGANHTWWRTLMNDLLSPSAVRECEPMVTEVVDHQIDAFASRGTAELVSEFAYPIPGIVIGRVVGFDHDDSLQSQKLAQTALSSLARTEFESAVGAFAEFTVSRLHQRREHPTDDFLSQLASGSYHGLDVDDGVAFQILLGFLGGGFHSTASGISGLVHHVLTQVGLRDRVLRDDRDLKKAIDESLRLTTPLQLFARTVASDTDLAGVPLPKGSRVLLNFAAANRDPDTFDDPDKFNLGRHPNRHLAFGAGTHLCVGQHLARLEMRIALTRLLRRLPDIALSEDAQFSGLLSGLVMNITSMLVQFSPIDHHPA